MTDIMESRPKGHVTVQNEPAWWVMPASIQGGAILQLFHSEHGWLNFHLSPNSAKQMANRLVEFGGRLPPLKPQ